MWSAAFSAAFVFSILRTKRYDDECDDSRTSFGSPLASAEVGPSLAKYEGNWYFDSGAVHAESLKVTDRTYTCPIKGTCNWVDYVGPDGRAVKDVAWVRLVACPSSQPSSTAPVCSAPPLPQILCPVCPRLDQDFEAFRQAAYWKAMHTQLLQRSPAQNRDPTARGNGPSSRATTFWGARPRPPRRRLRQSQRCARANTPPRRPRGQPGRPSPKRRDYSHLPAIVHPQVLPPKNCRCSRADSPSLISPAPGFHHPGGRCPGPSPVIRRRRYRPSCPCARSFRHHHLPRRRPGSSPRASFGFRSGSRSSSISICSTVRPIDSCRSGHPLSRSLVGHGHRRPQHLYCLCSSQYTKRRCVAANDRRRVRP